MEFEEEHAPGGPLVEATVSRERKAATGHTPITPPPKKTRTAAPARCGAGRCPVLAGPKVVSPSHAKSQGHGTLWRCRNELVRPSQHWQVPKILLRVSMHCCAGMLQHAPGDTLASLL